MGESAGGYLTCMAALDQDKKLDTGEYLEYSSQVQAACPWYPPTDASHFPYDDVEKAAMSSESLLMGFNVMTHPQEAYENSPVFQSDTGCAAIPADSWNQRQYRAFFAE